MKIIPVIISLFLLSGCHGDAESIQKVGSDFSVGKLFTVDGCTVYRFKDGMNVVYFTNCQGQTSYSKNEIVGKVNVKKRYDVLTNSGGENEQ